MPVWKSTSQRILAPLLALVLTATPVLALSGTPLLEQEASVAWLRAGQVEARWLGRSGDPAHARTFAETAKVPLGSLWKLFVYAYLTETGANEPEYRCAARAASQEERYCCEPGGSVARDQALAKSCAPYFSPTRLGIGAAPWQAFWRKHSAPPWLLDLKQLKPETEIAPVGILAALETVAPQARQEARRAMLETALAGYGRDAWPQLGTAIRYKTYSWHRGDGSPFGGAAGWLADGTPFWFGARGSSRSVLTEWAGQLAAALPEADFRRADGSLENGRCVDVDFFARYPLRTVRTDKDPAPLRAGVLHGRYRLEFANSNTLALDAQGDMSLAENPGGTPAISGRFSVNEYVARVVEREGNAASEQAARALAIAARSYLFQNARYSGGCWHIADASRTQRVSPNPPGRKALAAAWFSDDVVLSGVQVRYHRDAADNNRMAWRDALAKEGQGWDFERILAAAYPKASFASLSGSQECARLAAAESWLAGVANTWRRKLDREPGFEVPEAAPKVCALREGHPYADPQRLRIYVRGWRSLEERITLAHEYLHLAFRFHPNGVNEDYVERLARRLIEG